MLAKPRLLAPSTASANQLRQATEAILKKLAVSAELQQLGKTKVFLRYGGTVNSRDVVMLANPDGTRPTSAR